MKASKYVDMGGVLVKDVVAVSSGLKFIQKQSSNSSNVIKKFHSHILFHSGIGHVGEGVIFLAMSNPNSERCFQCWLIITRESMPGIGRFKLCCCQPSVLDTQETQSQM